MKKKANTPKTRTRKEDSGRGRTDVEGQNPKANDAPDHDLYFDENRRNMYDPEVGRALTPRSKRIHRK